CAIRSLTFLREFPALRPDSRQIRLAHQEAIALPRRATALVDRPHDQALPAPHVACREYARNAGSELAVFRLRVAARVLLDAELIEQLILRAAETHREQQQLRRKDLLRPWNVPRQRPAIVLDPLDANRVDLLQMARCVVHELRCLDGVLT